MRSDGAEDGNLFTGLALDRADERRQDLEWLRERWQHARVVLLDRDGDALADAERRLAPVAASALDEDDFGRALYLGSRGDEAWFALAVYDATAARYAEHHRWVSLRGAAAHWDRFHSGLFAYARALVLWQDRARYCGRCGSPTRVLRAGHSLACSSGDCAHEQYPRLDPAIIVIVEHGDCCLLGRAPGWPTGRYSTLAGFVEAGESLEDAVRREVREEAGVRVGACRYHSSQPWPFPSSLMVGFHAQAIDDRIVLGDELEDVRWFSASDIVAGVERGELRLSSPISISHRLIGDWLAQRLDADTLAGVLRAAA